MAQDRSSIKRVSIDQSSLTQKAASLRSPAARSSLDGSTLLMSQETREGGELSPSTSLQSFPKVTETSRPILRPDEVPVINTAAPERIVPRVVLPPSPAEEDLPRTPAETANEDNTKQNSKRRRALTLPWQSRWVTHTLELPHSLLQHAGQTISRRPSQPPPPTTLVRVRADKHHHGYTVLPIIAAISWMGTLLALLICWLCFGVQPSERHSDILFISYVGAEPTYKPIFVFGCFMTAAAMTASLVADRYTRSLLGRTSTSKARASTMSLLSIIFGGIAGVFLIMLALYDLNTYQRGHWACAGVAFASVILCLFFNLTENEILRRDHPGNLDLKKSGVIKAFTLAIATFSMVTMYVLQTLSRNRESPGRMTRLNYAATMEWVLAAMVALYVLALCIDLGPSSRAYFRQVKEAEGYIEIVVPKYIPHSQNGATAVPSAQEQAKEIRREMETVV